MVTHLIVKTGALPTLVIDVDEDWIGVLYITDTIVRS